MDLKNKRVLVTGARGFVGQHLMQALDKHGVEDIIAPPRQIYDLRLRRSVKALFLQFRPQVVFHLAAICGGIGANREQPAKFFYDNLKMGMEVMDEAYETGVEKFVQVGSVCSYPKYTPVPFKESDLWNGYPEETNAPYGIAKKALLTMSQAYRQQYGFNSIYLIPVNLYGPGGDNFHLNTSHVIPALIRQMVSAKKSGTDITLWGTGAASREFLYVDDCARGLIQAAERYDGIEPVNLGVGEEITIRDLATVIARLVGYEGKINYDPSKPDGQPRRCLDTSRAEDLFGFKATTTLEEGLKATIENYILEEGLKDMIGGFTRENG